MFIDISLRNVVLKTDRSFDKIIHETVLITIDCYQENQ